MNINREWETVQKLTYSGKDEYGQLRIPNSETSSEDIAVVWKIFNKANVVNPNYVDVDVICLTVADVSTKNVISRNGELYNVKFVIPGKYNQVYLQKC